MKTSQIMTGVERFVIQISKYMQLLAVESMKSLLFVYYTRIHTPLARPTEIVQDGCSNLRKF